jgi:SAM-dependent methyltransferase
MITINIENLNKKINLKWTEECINDLKLCAVYQQGPGNWIDIIDIEKWQVNKFLAIDSIPNDKFFNRLEKIWNIRINYIFRFVNYNNKLSQSKKYLEIGSGISILGLILSQVYKNIDFYFVDNNLIENIINTPFYNNNHHAFYNKFNVIKDCVSESNINENKIHLLTPDNIWPNDIDIISSYGSYCWHYSPDVYLNRLEEALLPNGHLILEVLHHENNLQKLTDKFNDPKLEFLYTDKKIILSNAKHGIFDRSMINLTDSLAFGGRYLWIKS